jgi:RimJ/RimL family protein N-acetyltransferase
MKQLPAGQFQRVAALIEHSEMKGCHAKWYSVLEGRQKGAVFVDDTANPQTVLVCGQQIGAYYAFGKANTELFRRFVPELLSEHVTEGYCAIFATSEAWRQTLDELFATRHSRVAFDFRPSPGCPPSDWRERIPPGFVLRRVDVTLAERLTERIQASMHTPRPWFSWCWGSIESFLAHGFGFCLIFEQEVASSCVSVAIGGGEAEIQINTYHPRFHRRGLATLTSAAFIEHCLTNGLRPGWTTNIDNRPSAALGEKVGFVPVGEIFGYRLDRSYQLSDGRWGPVAE